MLLGGFIIKRLKNNQFTIYDTQIIIYYCFLYKQHRIIDLTTKARLLTEFLINNDVQIVVSESVISEIRQKGFEKIISEYTNSKSHQILGLINPPSNTFKFHLQRKIEGNFDKMINANWFEVRSYLPDVNLIDSIKEFFNDFEDRKIRRIFN